MSETGRDEKPELPPTSMPTKNHCNSTAREAAEEYVGRGWSVLPIPHRSKNPGIDKWQEMRIGPGEIGQHFNGKPQNIGVLLGQPSGWLIDIDLDHMRCVELADQYLPATPAVFGRPGKPRSHRVYRVTRPAATKKFKSKSAGMLVEFRSTGMQTVFPPSVHESGESIEWVTPGAEPAEVDPDKLLEAVTRLADAVKVELGEKAIAPSRNRTSESKPPKPDRSAQRAAAPVSTCVNAMLRMRLTDNNDGSGRLFAAACRVVEHDLRDEVGLSAIREYERQRPFPRTWTDEEILRRIRDAESKVERGVIARTTSEGKSKVVLGCDEYRVVSERVAALAADEGIFHRGGLVRVIREHSDSESIKRSAGNPAITFLPIATLRERLTKHIEFTQFIQRGKNLVEVITHPTPWLVAAVSARGEWPGIRPLIGVSDVPVLRNDGSLWQTAGYDERTAVLYEPSDDFPMIPASLSRDDAIAAWGELAEVVCDFQFESDDHRAAWLAGLLTPLARFAFEGPSPLFLIDANMRGAGKGLLSQTIGQIVLGREMPVSSYAHDPEEMRKKVTSIAIAGDRMVLLDNLEGSFGNDTLDRALTTTRWKDRILGKSEQVDLPLIPVWYGTGNNVAVASDTTRRIIHIRLDVLSENPEERSGFRHENLVQWIRGNRPRLLTRALTILKAYFDAGLPHQDVSPFGSFEGWSRLVRGAIVWLGLPDPCATRVKLAEQSDTTADSLGQLMAAWRAADPCGNGVVIAELISRLYSGDYVPRDDESNSLRAALENIVGCPPGKTPTPRQVGAKLKFFRRRTLNGRFFDTNPHEPRRNGAVWRLLHV